MSAANFVGRVGGIAAALGVGVVVLGGTAVAAADTDVTDHSTRASASTSASSTAGPTRGANRSPAGAVKSAAAVRGRAGSPSTTVATPAASALPAKGSKTVTVSAAAARAASVKTPSAAVTAVLPPSPDATVATPYGNLGQWMLNKNGQVADWIGQPYCGPGSTVGNCGADTPGAKTIQEPINMVFVVQAGNEWFAKLKLDFALRISGFGPSCCSSIGYQGIVGNQTYAQLPTGGILGLGILPPLPFGLGQTGLLGLVGFGPAYRDAPFWEANSHLRVFGGESDGNGNYIFTGSVSEENLDTSTGGLLPTHGYESFDQARSALTDHLLNMGWLTGASDQGLIDMDNAIPADDPTYTTGDADGLAQVIALGSIFASSPARSVRPAA